MLLGPDEMACPVQYRHTGWLAWYGTYTRHYWALARWAPLPHGLLGAATPEALDAAIAAFELLHPKPAHALAT